MTPMTNRALISAGGRVSTRLCAGARKLTESNLKDVNCPKSCAFNPPTNDSKSVEVTERLQPFRRGVARTAKRPKFDSLRLVRQSLHERGGRRSVFYQWFAFAD